MRKRMLLILCLAFCICLGNTSCIGSFGLLNKFSSWNQRATPHKFLNGFLGILLTPVYGVCFTVDWFVLNTIEFWSGKKLLAANTTQRIVGSNGEVYLVKAENGGYFISNESGDDSMRLVFDDKNKEWSCEYQGASRKLFRVSDSAKTLTVYTPNGEEVEVSNDDAGMKELQALLYQSATPVLSE